VEDDGFDGRIVAELLQLPYDRLRREDHTVEIDYANAVAEAAQACITGAGMQSEVDERKHGQHEEEEGSSSDQDPEQGT